MPGRIRTLRDVGHGDAEIVSGTLETSHFSKIVGKFRAMNGWLDTGRVWASKSVTGFAGGDRQPAASLELVRRRGIANILAESALKNKPFPDRSTKLAPRRVSPGLPAAAVDLAKRREFSGRFRVNAAVSIGLASVSRSANAYSAVYRTPPKNINNS